MSNRTLAQAPPYTVAGTVYVDHDNNALFDGMDYGHPGITVLVFEDVNANGIYDGGESLLGSDVTGIGGVFSITIPVATGPEFTINIDPDDLAAGYTISNGPFTRTVGNYLNESLSFQGENVVCYTVADATSPDNLLVVNRKSGTHAFIGTGLGVGVEDVEAMSFDIGANVLYAINADQLGTIDISTGVFTALPNALGTLQHTALGSLLIDDADGMSFDPFTGELYATARFEGTPDVLFKIDVTTGLHVSDAFGAGIDYQLLVGPGLSLDVDDIGISPLTDIMYGINNNDGANDVLVEIDKMTGAMTTVGTITTAASGGTTALTDVEGFGFTNSGILIATTGNNGSPSATNNSVYIIDLTTSQATLITNFTIGSDYEACDCLTQRENKLSGTVFFDEDKNGIQNGAEAGASGITVYIYIDTNGDGIVNAGDVQIDAIITDINGNYSWVTASNLNFAITLEPATFPPLYGYTGNTVEPTPFGGGFGGQLDPGNNFGIASTTSFPVELVDFSVSQQGLGAALSWVTASEVNSDYFSIERSLDPISFSSPVSLGRVKAAGNASGNKTYTFFDGDVALQGTPRAYYRLRTVDFDGTYDYSNIVELQLRRDAGLQVRISPNPVSGDFVTVDYVGERAGTIEYRILSAAGQTIERHQMTNLGESGSFEIATQDLPSGLYLIQVSNGYSSRIERLSVLGH